MFHFCGYDLALSVERVHSFAHGYPAVCVGQDLDMQRWLVVLVDHDPNHLCWVCSPTTDRAIAELDGGNATPADLCRHSVTGWVEVVTVEGGRPVRDRCLLCPEIELFLARIASCEPCYRSILTTDVVAQVRPSRQPWTRAEPTNVGSEEQETLAYCAMLAS